MSPINVIHRALASHETQPEQTSVPQPPSASQSNTRQPSARNLEIYRRVVANCEPQSKIATELNLHPSRISQILRRVRAHLSATPTAASPNLQSPISNNQSPILPLLLTNLILKNENLFELILRDFHSLNQEPPASFNPQPQSQAQETHPDASSANPRSQIPNPKSEIPYLPAKIQLLKAAHRSLTELRLLYQLASPPKSQIPNPKSQISPTTATPTPEPPPDDRATLNAISSLLSQFRDKAEDEGRVPRATNSYQLLHNILASYLGLERGPGGGGFLELDDAIRHFAKTFLISPANVYPRDPEPDQLLADLCRPRTPCGPAETVVPNSSKLSSNPQDSPPTPHSELRTPHSSSPNVQSQIPNLQSQLPNPQSTSPPPLNSSQLERRESYSPVGLNTLSDVSTTPTADSTSNPHDTAAPAQKPPRKKSPPSTPQLSTPKRPITHLIPPIPQADFDAMFHPWIREF